MKSTLIIIFILILIQACASNNPTTSVIEGAGNISLSLAEVNDNNVKIIALTLSNSNSSSIHRDLDIDDSSSKETVISNIQTGNWNLKIEIKNRLGNLVYEGDGKIVVSKNETTPISIQTNPSNGKVVININWIEKFLDGIVALYTFSGNANDYSGNGNHGKVEGPVLTEDRFGAPNGAYYFDGIDDYIRLNDADKLSPVNQKLTIAAWIKNSGSKNKYILYKGDRSNNREYALGISKDSQAAFHINHQGNWNESQQGVKSNAIIMDEEWYLITSTWDGTSLKIYINGVLDNSISLNSEIGNYDSDLFLGTYGGRINEYALDGTIDDLIILNKTLSQQEISLLYNTTKNWSNNNSIENLFLTHVPFNNDGEDISKYENNVNIYGGTFVDGIVGNAIYLDGINDYISIPHQNHLNSDAKTIMFWMNKSNDYIRDTPGLNDVEGIAVKSWDTGWNRDFSFAISNQEPPFDIYLTAGNGQNQLLEVRAQNKIQSNKWYHVVGMIDKQSIKLFINGEFITETPFTGEIFYNDSPIIIGKASVQSRSTRYFNGKIDDFMILNKTLTVSEINYLYSLGN